MLSVITNIYNKNTKGATLMELFTATGKLKKFFWQLEMFDVRTTDHYNSEEYRCTHVDARVARTWISYPCVPITRGQHIEHR
jgi:hypothetical protein